MLNTLKKRMKQLTEELEAEKRKNAALQVGRQKIGKMSSEVVDSNPYR